jgi:hypothetical protein
LGQLEPGEIQSPHDVDELDTSVRNDWRRRARHQRDHVPRSIIAREYGLPTVVGTDNANRRIKTGDSLRVDGGSGRVTILPDPDDHCRGPLAVTETCEWFMSGLVEPPIPPPRITGDFRETGIARPSRPRSGRGESVRALSGASVGQPLP